MPFDAATLVAYCFACILLIASPGPGQALVIARTVESDARAGITTAVGLQIGTLVHTVAAALGLSAILATSATAFTVVKYVGAAYLIVLGILTLRAAQRTAARESASAASAPTSASGATSTSVSTSASAPRDRRLLMHAVVTGILNPKVALFFLAFLPQFVHPERGMVLVQFLALGAILSILGVIGDSLVALAAGRLSGRLLANPRLAAWRERATAIVLIAIGLRLAFVART